ncbi:MAG TPA: toll/interleukin-1 receptor domain-containing protein [Methyloceanibacter sp.]|nr:toll/interleukin-1 receptor domain-containing protein [Methyloceanibacter sp.]
MAKKIFISYRREDAAAAAGRVYDRLSRLLPKQNLFFDVSTIGGGEDFVQRIEKEIGESDAVLVFIGEKWLEPGASEKARLWEPDDFVRAELRAALARRMLVLPILTAGARMPRPEQLPEDVRALALKNALALRHESFDADTESIVGTVLGLSAKERAWDDKGSLKRKIAFGAGGAIAAALLMLAAAVLHYSVLARPLSASIGAPPFCYCS